jgi:cell division protein FtsW
MGLVMVFSSSANMAQARFGSTYLFVRKQLLWDCVGFLAMLFFMRVDYHRWQKLAYALLGLALVSLGAVLAVGPVIKGARRWIRYGGFTFQPSELAKLALILAVASFLDRHRSHLKNFNKGLIPVMLVIGLTLGLIVMEPDLGTPLMLGSVSLMLIFLAGAPGRYLVGMLCVSLLPVYYLLFHVSYRRRRLLAFLNPWASAQGTGYQVTQSLLAFGSGGLFGKGLGASTLKLLYLPDPHTDFIFPIIGEELGFIGAASVIVLFLFWGMRGWQASRRAPDLFGQLLAAGITCWILLQAAINMGVSCGILPTKGLPLPFISFGGSSSVITLIAVGILLNISSRGEREKIEAMRKMKS